MKRAEAELALLGPMLAAPDPDYSQTDRGQAFSGEPELPVTDPGDLDRWYEGLGQQRSMSAAELNSNLFGWAEGEGVKV